MKCSVGPNLEGASLEGETVVIKMKLASQDYFPSSSHFKI